MDHQLPREEQRLTGVHLRTCAECAARFEELRRRSTAVSGWLADLGVELPDPNKRAVALAAVERARFRSSATGPLGSGWMRAAAMILLTVGFALGTGTGRAWLAGAIVRLAGDAPPPAVARVLEWLGEDERLAADARLQRRGVADFEAPSAAGRQASPTDPRPPVAALAPPPPGMSPPLRFEPEGPDVALYFDNIQRAGSATVWIRDVPAASAQVVAHLAGEALVPTPEGLAVRNRGDSRADYEITVPSRFRYVRIRIGEGQEMFIPIRKSKREWIWTINLQRSALEQ
jgi:hypothetical protein